MDAEPTTAEPLKPPGTSQPDPVATGDGDVSVSADRFDVVVLGGERAGEIAAREIQRRGLRVAIVVPVSEACDGVGMWAAEHALRRFAEAVAKSDRISSGTPEVDFASLVRRANELRARLAPRPAADELARLGVTVIRGRPTFIRRNALKVENRELVFRKAVLATGLVSPTNLDEDEAEPLDSRRILAMEALPQRLAILGSGPRACQWAQTFRRLGCEVCLVAAARSMLAAENPLATKSVLEQLAREGIHLLPGCDSVAVQRTGTQHAVVLEREGRQEKRFVDRVFREMDQTPNWEGLDLQTAGVACTASGVEINDRLQTTNRRIFAAGGVCGPQFAAEETAEAMARLCAHNISRIFSRKMSRTLATRCVWTDPEIAEVGLTAPEAARRQIEIDTYRAEMSEVGAAVLDGREAGFVAIYTRHNTGRILGATVVAHRAGELIGPLRLVIERRIPLDALADCAACQPSRFEVLALIADYYCRHRPPSRWQLVVEKIRAWWKRLRRSSHSPLES